jgi:alpha/beta superfamily hydrolase
MPAAPRPTVSPVAFATSDGTSLLGDLSLPAAPRAAAIICHPHPQHGGNRHDHVVEALFTALPAAGIAALRFDFRREFGGGIAEIDDASAAITELERAVPDVPILAAGYSFGAMVVLAVDSAPIVGKILVAPPLAAMPNTMGRPVPTLVICPEHDQFTPPSAAAPIVASWERAQLTSVPMADHFLRDRTSAVVETVEPWIDALIR